MLLDCSDCHHNDQLTGASKSFNLSVANITLDCQGLSRVLCKEEHQSVVELVWFR